MSRLIETIRFSEGRPENLDYHLRRMTNSSLALWADTLHWNPENLLRDVVVPRNTIYKVRLVYDPNSASITSEPYTIKPVCSLKLVFDNDVVYDHKLEDRSYLIRLMAMKEECDDILIVKNGLITDVSYANVIFRKGDRWFTPDSFLLNGTTRQRLLDNRRITEQRITVDDLRRYSHFKLINAMLLDDAPESEVVNIH